LPTNEPNQQRPVVNSGPAMPRDLYEGLSLLRFAALHQVNYATIDNYLKGELRYMDAGE
jgi:hypothetical protein